MTEPTQGERLARMEEQLSSMRAAAVERDERLVRIETTLMQTRDAVLAGQAARSSSGKLWENARVFLAGGVGACVTWFLTHVRLA